MDVAAELDRHRRHLLAVAYRMLGSMQDAEDVLQEAWVRVERADPDGIDEPRAWLTRVVSRLALDHLRSARVRRERYVGPWLPEPLVDAATPVAAAAPTGDDAPGADPADRVALHEHLSMALMAVLETLSPAERAVYVLHEAFGLPFDQVAGIVGRSPAACRQLARRARRHVEERAPRFDPDPAEQARVVTAFRDACDTGDLDALAALLDDRAVLRSDGGGVVPAARRPVEGRDRIRRAVAALLRADPGITLRTVRVNGEPGLLAAATGGRAVLSFVVHRGRITQIDVVANPDKLGRLGDL